METITMEDWAPAGWAQLKEGEHVIVGLNGRWIGTGVVDALTQDASTIWVVFDGAYTRKMFLQGDPENIIPLS